jgi:hypothetical protein
MRLRQNGDTGRQNWVRRTTLFFGPKATQAEFVKNFTSARFRAKKSFTGPGRLLIFEEDVFTRWVGYGALPVRKRGRFF